MLKETMCRRSIAVVVLALLGQNAGAQQQPCHFITSKSPLNDRLSCTATRRPGGTLGSFLRGIADNVTLRGTVAAVPTINVYPFTDDPPRTLACGEIDHFTPEQFLAPTTCFGHQDSDGDLTFNLVLDEASQHELRSLMLRDGFADWWSQDSVVKDHVHVEAIMMGRKIGALDQWLFPGWKKGEGFSINGAAVRYSGFFDCRDWRPRRFCAELHVGSGGRRIEPGTRLSVTGALVIDCDLGGTTTGCVNATPAAVEIHPAYSIVIDE